MAIKIPRADIEVPSVGKRGTALLDTARTNRINYEGFTSELSSIAQTIKAHNDKINQRRIQNKSTKYNAKMATDAQDFSQKIEIGKYNVLTKTYDPYTADEINKKLKKFETDMEGKYKNKIFKGDNDGWEHFASYYWGNLKKADHGAHQGTKRKILADTAIAYSTAKTTQAETIKDTPASEVMWIVMNNMIEQEKKLYMTSRDAVPNIDLTKNIQAIKNEFLVKAVKAGNEKILADGTKGYNWQKIIKDINSDKDYYNYKLNETEKDGLLAYAKDQAVEQDYFENRWKKQHNDTIFKDNIDGIRDGSTKISTIEGLEFTKDLAGEKLKNGLIEYARKKQLGEIGNESNINQFLELRKKIISGDVTSLHEPIELNSDTEEYILNEVTGEYEYTTIKGQSILERVTNGSLGDTDFGRLYTIIQDPQLTTNLREFDKLVTAYEPQILGKLKDYDLKAKARLYEVETILEKKFKKGLKEGLNADNMLDPQHKDFILTDELLTKYVLSLPQQIESVAESMSSTTSDAEWKGPVWNTYYKKKYNGDVNAFNDGVEMKRYMETDGYKKFMETANKKDIKIVTKQIKEKKKKDITTEKKSSIYTFKEYEDGSVEKMPSASITSNRYFYWVGEYGKTHNADGSLKDKATKKKGWKVPKSNEQKYFKKEDGYYYHVVYLDGKLVVTDEKVEYQEAAEKYEKERRKKKE